MSLDYIIVVYINLTIIIQNRFWNVQRERIRQRLTALSRIQLEKQILEEEIRQTQTALELSRFNVSRSSSKEIEELIVPNVENKGSKVNSVSTGTNVRPTSATASARPTATQAGSKLTTMSSPSVGQVSSSRLNSVNVGLETKPKEVQRSKLQP